MIFVSIEDFFEKAASCHILNRQDEILCAEKMKSGDRDARQKIIESYIPMAANHIKRLNPQLQQMGLAVYCMHALEKAVDSFDFLQESETFVHRLSWWLRDATARYIVSSDAWRGR